MSQLQLRYSEAYDASLSGWTGSLDEAYFADHYDEWLNDYVKPGQAFVAQAQEVWDRCNDRVFTAFRSFGYEFTALWPAYAVHKWPGVVGFKDPLTFFIDEDLDAVIVLLIHELVHCHEDYAPNVQKWEEVRDHIFERFSAEHIAVKYHIVTNFTQWAVMRRAFPERWKSLLAISYEHPFLKRAADILFEHEGQLDYDDPLGSLLKL
ncbi:MAG: hypothetical protein AAF702_22160 [Chloroflexota bacterium]